MKTFFVRSVAALSIAFLAACGSDEVGAAKIKKLEPGITLEEAAAQLGPGPLIASGSDTSRLYNGYRRNRYLRDGVVYDVLYVRDAVGDVKDPLLQSQETPVVFREGKLIGGGWRFYVEEAMGKYGLPTPLRARDTMTVDPRKKAQQDSAAKQDSAAAGMPNAAADSAVPQA